MVSADWLRRVELFEALNDLQLNALLTDSVVKDLSEGETIFRQGDHAGCLYILIEGAIRLSSKTEERIEFMTSRIEKEGAVFGIPSLIKPFRHNVTATSLKPSKVLVLEADQLRKDMEEDPRMGMHIMGRLASIYFNRLNEMRKGISNFVTIFKNRVP